jgi:hypothetical protein
VQLSPADAPGGEQLGHTAHQSVLGKCRRRSTTASQKPGCPYGRDCRDMGLVVR